jgi:hypothetical protein
VILRKNELNEIIIMIPNVFFIILISIFTLCISFVSTKGTISNLRHKKKLWKIITLRGWLVITFTLLIIALLIWQNYINEYRSDQKDIELKNERAKSDSICNPPCFRSAIINTN